MRRTRIKRARPALRITALRNMAMVVRISEDEHRKFTEMADAKGLMLSSWVRMTLKEALEGVR